MTSDTILALTILFFFIPYVVICREFPRYTDPDNGWWIFILKVWGGAGGSLGFGWMLIKLFGLKE